MEKSRLAIAYATLIELHHPDYLSRNDLLGLYPFDARALLRPQQVEEMKSLGLGAA